jgi:putative DNA primase/helicase
MLEAAEQFREAIRAAGLAPPDTIEADGNLRRFAGDGRRGSDASWYVLHGDGIPAGAFGDWRTGFSQTWRADTGRKLTPAEEAAHRARVEAMRQAREAEEARAHQEAAAKAAEILRSGRKDDISGHPYAAKKAIDFGPLVRRGAWPQRGWIDALLVPIYNADGQVISLEAINASGDKDFLRGGAKRGGIHPIGNIKTVRRVLIAEGIANAAVAIAALGDPAVAAMDAGNLKAAGETVRQINPGAELVFLADNDVREDGRNPGAEAATSAALALGGKVAIPELDGRKCDFWDLWHEHGAEAVRRAVEAASAPAGGKGSPEGEYALDVNLIRGCDIRPEPIEWIWGGWLAAGKMHILGGAPGTGKTTIALAFAATVTGGGRWPDGTRSSVGNVVIWSGEDDPADTLIPRLSLSGADLSRVYFIADIREGSERRSFDPARDMEPLQRKLAEIGGVKLLIVDPIVSAIAGDSHKNAEVRRGCNPWPIWRPQCAAP